ncbi:MAG: glycosyltransferase family 39 protein [Hyphomicrobiaceae bacterium]
MSMAGGRAEVMTGGEAADTRSRGLWTVAIGVIVYIVLHAGFRLLASDVLGEDDTLEQIMVQELRLGYEARQPPLYDWVLYSVQRLTGPSVVSFLAIKYAALLATALLIYTAAFRILADRLWALLTVESLALIYQIAWRYHEGFTHEVLAMVAVAATLNAFLRLYDHGRWSDYLLFGVIAGLGLLTEPNFAVYQLCLWGAALLLADVRRRIRSAPLVAAFALALAIASPYLLWLLSDPAHWNEIFQPSLRGWVGDRLVGAKDALRGPIMYLLPLVAILPAVFPGYLATAAADVRRLATLRSSRAAEAAEIADDPASGSTLELLVLATLLLGIVWSLIGGMALGIGGYAMHVLMPLYVTSIIWLMGVAKRSPRAALRMPVFAKLALGIAVLALLVRLANMFVLDPVCGKCRWGIPYDGLASALRAEGVSETTTFLAVDDELAGNLRQHFPAARFVLIGPRRFMPDGVDLMRDGLTFVWDPAAKGVTGLPAMLAGNTGRRPSLAEGKALEVPWRHLWRPEGYRTSQWRMLPIPPSLNAAEPLTSGR